MTINDIFNDLEECKTFAKHWSTKYNVKDYFILKFRHSNSYRIIPIHSDSDVSIIFRKGD